jgi:hypothetical protein
MKTIEQMWERLAQHQPEADKRGYGQVWKHMCNTRTMEAADAAGDAAWDAAGDAAGDAAAWAACAAEAAAWAASAAWFEADAAWDAAEYVESRAKRAIEYIERAEENK